MAILRLIRLASYVAGALLSGAIGIRLATRASSSPWFQKVRPALSAFFFLLALQQIVQAMVVAYLYWDETVQRDAFLTPGRVLIVLALAAILICWSKTGENP